MRTFYLAGYRCSLLCGELRVHEQEKLPCQEYLPVYHRASFSQKKILTLLCV